MSSYRLARLTFPPELPEATADDIVATAAELGGDRWSARQSLGLMAYGLRTRGRLATDGRHGRYWAQGIGFALVVMFLAQSLMWTLHASGVVTLGLDSSEASVWLPPLASSVLALAVLLRSTRSWALLVVLAIEFGPLIHLIGFDDIGSWGTLALRPVVATSVALLIAVAALARLGDGRPAGSAPSTLLTALPVAIAAVLLGHATYAALVVPMLGIVGLATIRLDPRWAIGGATVLLLNLVGLLALGSIGAATVGLAVAALLVLATAHRSIARLQPT